MEMKVCKSQEDLKQCIEFLAEDLKSRAEEISQDWDKQISKIEISTTIEVGELLNWKVSKTMCAIKKMIGRGNR